MNRCPGDDSFGPVLSYASDCYNFDFTLVFEDAILAIPPAAILIPLAAWRLAHLVKSRTVVKWSSLRFVKIVSTCVH